MHVLLLLFHMYLCCWHFSAPINALCWCKYVLMNILLSLEHEQMSRKTASTNWEAFKEERQRERETNTMHYLVAMLQTDTALSNFKRIRQMLNEEMLSAWCFRQTVKCCILNNKDCTPEMIYGVFLCLFHKTVSVLNCNGTEAE